MIIPEDGCLPPITSSNLNAFNNIMIVKVNNNWKSHQETTYQLATLDRSKKGTIWPADNYVSELIPSLPENKILDEHTKAFESKKKLNLSINTTTVRPKLVCQPDQMKYYFAKPRKPNMEKRKNWSENYNFQSKPDINGIEPWVQNPWGKQPIIKSDEGRDVNILPLSLNGRIDFPDVTNKSFHGFCPPETLDNVHHNLSSDLPLSGSFPNEYPEYLRKDHFTNLNSCDSPFDETSLPGSSKQYSYNYRQNSRKKRSSNRRFNNFARNASNRGSRHDSPPMSSYNSYMRSERDNFDTDFMYEQGYSGNDNVGRTLLISPNTLHDSYVPDSRHDQPHTSFENTYIDHEMDTSISYDNLGEPRNNPTDTSYQVQYPRAQNRKRWRHRNKFNPRQNMNFMKPRGNVNSMKPKVNSNSRGNVNSLNVREGMNSGPRDNANSLNFRETVNSIPRGNKSSLKFMGNQNSEHRFNAYNKIQRKPWMFKKDQNFKSSYNGNQKVNKNFRGSNIRP